MPIKHLPYPLYVLTQAWVFNLVEQRKINLVRYGRLMKTGGNLAKCGMPLMVWQVAGGKPNSSMVTRLKQSGAAAQEMPGSSG